MATATAYAILMGEHEIQQKNWYICNVHGFPMTMHMNVRKNKACKNADNNRTTLTTK